MITLYTSSTPNGWKISIALEELGLPYQVHAMNLDDREHKQPWFLEISPAGQIPAIVDHDADDLPIFESGAILMYLAEKTGRLIPSDLRGRSETIQWLMFQTSGIGPMMGQANVFYRYAPQKNAWAIDRYHRECRRLFEVLERRLVGRTYLVDEMLTIADIANYAWVHTFSWSGVSIKGLPALKEWLERLRARDPVQRGLHTPPRDPKPDVEARGRRLLV